jgi:hypothetical protein
MSTFVRIVAILTVVGAVLAGTLTLTPAANAAPEPPPFGCPEGWVRVSPDLNPLLRCQPNTIAPNGNQGEPFAFQSSTGLCPDEGWRAVVHPLNPALMCLPTNLVAGIGNPDE